MSAKAFLLLLSVLVTTACVKKEINSPDVEEVIHLTEVVPEDIQNLEAIKVELKSLGIDVGKKELITDKALSLYSLEQIDEIEKKLSDIISLSSLVLYKRADSETLNLEKICLWRDNSVALLARIRGMDLEDVDVSETPQTKDELDAKEANQKTEIDKQSALQNELSAVLLKIDTLMDSHPVFVTMYNRIKELRDKYSKKDKSYFRKVLRTEAFTWVEEISNQTSTYSNKNQNLQELEYLKNTAKSYVEYAENTIAVYKEAEGLKVFLPSAVNELDLYLDTKYFFDYFANYAHLYLK